MKYAVFGFTIFFLLLTSIPEANAVVCARGVRGAACAGPRGAVAVRRTGCARVRGVLVCR
jgi:hypothetical protein